ncbi:hypothetical protein [Oceanicaulis sp.]|uniref:hypothetical protein n=1 Tax=Oceanicaulis sp. TaxID=1924941 RepID=UPI003F71E235
MFATTAVLLALQAAHISDVHVPAPVLSNFAEQLQAEFQDTGDSAWSIPLGGADSAALIPTLSAQNESREDSDELSAFGVGLELETSPLAFGSISRLSLIVSYDQETVIMRPGGGGVSALTRVAGEVGVADGFAGLGMSLNDHGAVTAGYIRQQREIRFGENSWNAQSNFVGLSYRQAW